MALRFASEGEPTRCPSMMEGDHPCGEGIEIDARGLNLLNGPGDAPAGIPGLWAAEVTNGTLNGKPGTAWLLDAEDVGIGGENGRGGYCIDVCRLIDVAGEIAGGGGRGGSSSPNETPRARSLASLSSSTYFFQAASGEQC